MLILTRHLGKTVMIGDAIEVCVLGVKGMQVRIGIEAPKDVVVLRQELVGRSEAERGGVMRCRAVSSTARSAAY